MLERRYTTKEAARLLGYSVEKVRNLINAGRLPAVNSSSGSRARWEIAESAISEFLKPAAVGSSVESSK